MYKWHALRDYVCAIRLFGLTKLQQVGFTSRHILSEIAFGNIPLGAVTILTILFLPTDYI